MQIEARLEALGLVLPEAAKLPPNIKPSFSWVRIRGNRAYISGHGPQHPDGSITGPFGKVGVDVSPDDAYQAARLAALAVLGSLKRALGDLDRVTAWLMVHGMVNAIPGSSASTNAINGFSDLILELYGPEIGEHARTAVGMAALPLNLPVIVAAEVEIAEATEIIGATEPISEEEAILEVEG
ncbi:MAG: RidA family protein [Thermomicrobiales bacterium]